MKIYYPNGEIFETPLGWSLAFYEGLIKAFMQKYFAMKRGSMWDVIVWQSLFNGIRPEKKSSFLYRSIMVPLCIGTMKITSFKVGDFFLSKCHSSLPFHANGGREFEIYPFWQLINNTYWFSWKSLEHASLRISFFFQFTESFLWRKNRTKCLIQ